MGLLQFFGLRPPFEPDLIDPHEYEAELLLALDEGSVPRPTPGIPSLRDRNWTCEEMEAMKKNRRLIHAIFDRVWKEHHG